MSARSMVISENQKLFLSLINEYAAEKMKDGISMQGWR